jgi:hypothetical protein
MARPNVLVIGSGAESEIFFVLFFYFIHLLLFQSIHHQCPCHQSAFFLECFGFLWLPNLFLVSFISRVLTPSWFLFHFLPIGMAGIRAARLLVDSGASVTILEGRDRIGGRLFSDRRLGFANDLGASWVRFQIPVNFYLTFRC